jgi:biotin-dependent carboxylase-like uncharacterized protein
LQDAGRFGVRQLGVTQGGPLDLHAWAWANHLVGNAWGVPALEITLGGLQLIAEQDLCVAVAGADLSATLEDRPLALWRTVKVRRGEWLTFGSPVSGLRAYLAVAGGFDAEPVLGSVACVSREGLGGFDGRGNRLAEGDRLPISKARAKANGMGPREAPDTERPDYDAPACLSFLPGAQVEAFTGRSLFDVFNSEWHVDDRADRMGVRLNGPRLHCRIESMISEGISLGAIQVPPDGQPIALLNDRQTIGGYPKLGNLTPLAASWLAQCMPGTTVRLRAVAVEHALAEHRGFLGRFV